MYLVRTGLLLAGLTSLFAGLGAAFGGQAGMLLALGLGVAMNFGAWFFSDTMVLRMYRAQIVTAADAPELYHLTAQLAQRAGLPMPTLAIVPEDQPNAFATGRSQSRAVVAVTDGLLRRVPRPELDAVIAHELAHIKNHDMLTSTIAASLAGAISQLPNLLFFFGSSHRDEDRPSPLVAIAGMILAPLVAIVLQMAISRQREYAADATAARLLGTVVPMQSALARLGSLSNQIPMDVPRAVAPLAQVSPFGSMSSGLGALFSTHPPLEKRIAALNDVRV